ncbi:MAG: hypothetical protein GQ574_05075 [Crocinitomix sp.]|nr:hypothetical protein [Crocinitomix sp.]
MKFEISKQPTFDELKQVIGEKFPDYKLKMQGKQFLIVKKSSSCGVNILVRKNKMLVAGNFPTMGGKLLFAVTLILGGILIPIIIYFAVFHKKFKAMEEEVGSFLQEQYAV